MASVKSLIVLYQTSIRYGITNLEMPAMSPTMTEGGIAGWKRKEGEAFSAGDVLLEIETDKATIDVEAQDDGIIGKILLQDGAKNVPVGKVIALLAEEGDDISNLQPPKEEKPVSKQATLSSSPLLPERPTPVPEMSFLPPSLELHSSTPLSHSRPLFPSVHRLLLEFGIKDPESIKGTGVRGMLTKGDVLAYLGKASGPLGTYKEPPSPLPGAGKMEKKEEYKPLDGPALRRLIVSTMFQSSLAARNARPVSVADFDSVVADYIHTSPLDAKKAVDQTQTKPKTSASDWLDGLY
ncbi:single hybrid motif-containing protein [Tricholoma matsutake]|nr:single hybrid motif-containing protein [Tricholoma matsutake 945]